MNAIEEKIIRGKITALEVALQQGTIPLRIILQDANQLITIEGITPVLETRLRNLILATTDDDE